MRKFIAVSLLSVALASPALAFGSRVVEFDAAAELQRATGSAQMPESSGGFVKEARRTQGGSQAYPEHTPGLPHSGADVIVGGSAHFPVLTPDALDHPPTALSQDQDLLHDFEG